MTFRAWFVSAMLGLLAGLLVLTHCGRRTAPPVPDACTLLQAE